MAEKYGIDQWAKLVKLTDCNLYDWRVSIKELEKPLGIGADYTFALGVVEGRPVFKGDELYHEKYGLVKILKFETGGLYAKQTETSYPICGNLGNYSWNPPKPKTVMVELSIKQVESLASGAWTGCELNVACAEALKQLEQ